MTGNNELTFQNVEEAGGNASIDANFQMDTSANFRDIEVAVFKNDAKVENAKIFVDLNDKSKNVGMTVPENFIADDVFDFRVRNLTNTNNILVTNFQIGIE